MSLAPGADGRLRCSWAVSAPEYERYHDEEWGRPVGDDDRVYEKLCLEGFQSGLSWLTILRKRDGFRKAFESFDPTVVSTFGADDVERLVQDPSIVRHRAKIEAAIGNAKATVALWDQGISLAGLMWMHEPTPAPTDRGGDVPSSTLESKALSTELRQAAFRFVGPTTVYAAMQSLGLVNDHSDGCAFRDDCDADRARFARPTRDRPHRS